MNAYPEYKESGIDWLGKIPTSWNKSKLKYIGEARNGLTYSPDDISDENGLLVLRSSNIKNEQLCFDDNVYVSKQVDELMMREGDILICSRNGSASLVGKSAIIPPNVNATFGAFMMRYRSNIDKSYTLYLIRTTISQYKSRFATSTINQLTNAMIGDMQIPVPPLDEQKAIAAYLDEKTGKIDELIVEKTKQVEDLRSFRTSVITEAVTHGLNPNAPLRQSGIDWLGEIPAHWALSKVKYSFENLDNLREPIASENRERINPKYDYYGASGVIDKVDGYNVDDTVLLIAEDGANLVMRNLPLIYKASGKIWVNNHAHILKPLQDVDYEYMYYYLESIDYNDFITGSAQPKLSQGNLANVDVLRPSLIEQQEIADYLDEKTAKIDKLISELNTQLAELAEYKQAVISEAVTGKVDVRDYKSSL
jgi:type I restriction enzyme S subunit